MPALLIRLRVADYPAWKRVFDEHGPIRWSNGCRGGQVFRSSDDRDELVILLTWDDSRRARLYSQSDEFRESMKGAGVIDAPDMWILEHADDIAR
jgi:heme-degrading monooxygenase HmoA